MRVARSTLVAPLALLAALSGCLELEGRPCASGADCLEGWRCRAATCVLVPEPGALIAAAGDLSVDQPLGDLAVDDSVDDRLVAELDADAEGRGELALEQGALTVRGEGPVDLSLQLPRRFDLEVSRAHHARVGERDGALTVRATGDLEVAHSAASAIVLETTGGDITLTLPAEVSAILDAEGREVVLDGLALSTGVNLFGVAGGTLGSPVSAAQRVELRAPNGTIRLLGR